MDYEKSHTGADQGPSFTSKTMNLEKYAANDNLDDFYSAEPKQVARQIERALKDIFPLVSSQQTLRLKLNTVFIDDSRNDALAAGRLTEFRYEGKSYQMPIKAEFSLEQKKGNGWVELNVSTINIGPYFPIVPSLNTRLIEGKLYQNKLQFRRQPGAYPHRNKAGDPLVEFNTAKGRSFNLGVDLNKKGAQTIDVRFLDGGKTAVPKAGYAILRAMGRSDDEIKKKWGEDIWAQNALDGKGEELKESALTALIDKTYNNFKDKFDPEVKSDSLPEAARRLRERLEGMKGALDPNIARQTLGVESDALTGDVMMSASEKLLGVYAGDDPPHRFSERFRTVHSIGSQIADSVSHYTFVRKFEKNVQRGLDKAEESGLKKVSDIISPSAKDSLKSTIRKAFTASDLSTATETTNIADIEARSKEVTIRGTGGIKSEYAITNETIAIHPSRLGLTGMVKTQVSAPGVVLPLAQSAVIDGDEVKRRVYDRKQGKIRAVTSEEGGDGGLAFLD